MRPGPSSEILAGHVEWSPKITSWYGGTMVSADVPVASGRVVASVQDPHRVRLTMVVPRQTVVDGTSFLWVPGADPFHPLAKYGQELDVSVLVRSAVSHSEWLTRVGRFLITGWDENTDGSVTVVGRGLLRRVEDSKMTTLSQPPGGATLMSEARRLAPAGVAVAFGAGLVDRAVPPSLVWSTDRYKAYEEIAEAWPALLRSDEWGQIEFRAPLPEVPTPVIILKDGEGGTVVQSPRSDTRDGAYNEVLARSSKSDAADVQAVAQQRTGPMAVGSPYGAVTKEWSSPLLENADQALSAAESMVKSSTLPAQVLPVTHAADPRIDLDDPAEVVSYGVRSWGWVVGYELPLTVNDGLQRTDVGVAA